MDRLLKSYLDSIQSAGSVDQLRDALTTIAASLGLHSVAYLALTRADKPLLISNYNSGRTTHCVARGYHLFDPVIRKSFRCTNSFGWGRTLLDRIALLPFGASSTKPLTLASVTAAPSRAVNGGRVRPR